MNCASMAPLFPASLLGSANESPQQEENGVFLSLLPSHQVSVVAYILNQRPLLLSGSLSTQLTLQVPKALPPPPLFTPSGPGVVKASLCC